MCCLFVVFIQFIPLYWSYYSVLMFQTTTRLIVATATKREDWNEGIIDTSNWGINPPPV